MEHNKIRKLIVILFECTHMLPSTVCVDYANWQSNFVMLYFLCEQTKHILFTHTTDYAPFRHLAISTSAILEWFHVVLCKHFISVVIIILMLYKCYERHHNYRKAVTEISETVFFLILQFWSDIASFWFFSVIFKHNTCSFKLSTAFYMIKCIFMYSIELPHKAYVICRTVLFLKIVTSISSIFLIKKKSHAILNMKNGSYYF